MMAFYSYPSSLRAQLQWAPWFDVEVAAQGPCTTDERLPPDGPSTRPVAPTHAPPPSPQQNKDVQEDTGLLLERSRTRLSVGQAHRQPDAIAPVRASLKVASHLRDGIGVVLTVVPWHFWTAHVPVAALQHALTESYPSVRLPDRDVLSAVARTLNDHTQDRVSLYQCFDVCTTAASTPVSVLPSVWRPHARVPRNVGVDGDHRCHGVWVIVVRCPLDVLRDYTVELEVAIPCTPWQTCQVCTGATATTAATPSPSSSALDVTEKFFTDMVFIPQQARLLALADTLLHVCQHTGYAVSDAARRVGESYSAVSAARIAERVRLAASGDTAVTSPSASSVEVVQRCWDAEREASAQALQMCFAGLELPPPVQAVAPLADDLQRLCRREMTDAIFAPRPADQDMSCSICEGRPRQNAPLPTTATLQMEGPHTQANGISARDGEASHTTMTSHNAGRKHTRETTPSTFAHVDARAGSRDAPSPPAEASGERKKKIRRLFS